MVLFRKFGFGLGATFGCAISAFFIEYYSMYHCWMFTGTVSLISLVVSCLLPNGLETNECACCLLGQTNNSIGGSNNYVSENQTFIKKVKRNFLTLKENIKEPLIGKLYLFLIG